jgi:hypothetical protein
MVAPLFKESNTKQEYVPTNVGTSSLVLLDRPNGPQNTMSQYNFENNWGVSVIDFGYGADEGLMELAVTKNGDLHYANPVSRGDVRGWLSDDEVSAIMEEVSSWKPNQIFPEWEED